MARHRQLNSSIAREPASNMRPRDRILANLESIYRESYDRAEKLPDKGRMLDLESAYMRDQLMLEILLDIRDLFSVAPAASGGSALEKLEAVRRLTKLR
jgi:hypothetical protein